MTASPEPIANVFWGTAAGRLTVVDAGAIEEAELLLWPLADLTPPLSVEVLLAWASPSRPLWKWVGTSTLAGTLLALTAQPTFWTDGKYLEPPTGEASPPSSHSRATQATTVAAQPSPDSLQASTPTFAPRRSASTAAARPTNRLQRSQGFRQPLVARSSPLPPPPVTSPSPSSSPSSPSPRPRVPASPAPPPLPAELAALTLPPPLPAPLAAPTTTAAPAFSTAAVPTPSAEADPPEAAMSAVAQAPPDLGTDLEPAPAMPLAEPAPATEERDEIAPLPPPSPAEVVPQAEARGAIATVPQRIDPLTYELSFPDSDPPAPAPQAVPAAPESAAATVPRIEPAPAVPIEPLAPPLLDLTVSPTPEAPAAETSSPRPAPVPLAPTAEPAPMADQSPTEEALPLFETSPLAPTQRSDQPLASPIPTEEDTPTADLPVPLPVEAGDPFAAETFAVEGFRVVGSTVFTADYLAQVAWQAALSEAEATCPDPTQLTEDFPLPAGPRSLSRVQLVRASEAITQCYLSQQYINSGAFIVPTALGAPIVEIQVSEGSLEAINVVIEPVGWFPLNPAYVRDRIQLAAAAPLNLDRLLEGVQLLEQDPLIEHITTEIVPGTQDGTSILNVSVVQSRGLDILLGTNNDFAPSVGSIGFEGSISQANLLGLGDRLSLGYEGTEGSNRIMLGYSLPLNARNGTLSFRYETAEGEVIAEPFRPLGIESTGRTYELAFRQPIIRTPNEELALSLTAYRGEREGVFLESFLGTAVPFPAPGADAQGRTRVTALRFGQEWIKRSPQQVFALFSEFSLGLDALGSTINPSPPDSQFFLWRGQGQWVRQLGNDNLFLLRGGVQFADRPLVPSEQFGLGGQTTVRGYGLNTLLTDSGWMASAEFRLPILRIPEIDSVVQLAPFFDIGGGWNQGNAFSPNPNVLAGTGLGLIWDIQDNFSARLDIGIPLVTVPNQGGNSLQESGIYFTINFSPF